PDAATRNGPHRVRTPAGGARGEPAADVGGRHLPPRSTPAGQRIGRKVRGPASAGLRPPRDRDRLLDRHLHADPRHLRWRRRHRGRLMTPALLPLFVGVPLTAAGPLAVLHRAPPWLRRPLSLAPRAAGVRASLCLTRLARA